ncbi:MAG TPA: DUF4249 domain-containing protein [Puia sp.]
MAVIIFPLTMCRKSYDPPVIKASNHFIAIDGLINTGTNGTTSITINRSLNLQDTVPNIPELNCTVLIQSETGVTIPLVDTGANGVYISAPLNLDPSVKYQVSVTTSDGNKYISDFVLPKTSPPIDSITWQLINDPLTAAQAVNIYVNAHDPSNSTRYYRWDYLETYQHRSTFESSWYIQDGLINPITDPGQSVYNCWSSAHSSQILLGTSAALSSDVISQALIASFAQNDPRMDVDYSILVRQYPLDLDAYKYWLTIQKNSQTLGGLFDLQPSQIKGNVRGITNPNDPVLGYVSASSISEQRLFISNNSLGWKSNPFLNCPIVIIPTDPTNTLSWNYQDTSYGVYYFNSGNPPTINIAHNECLDCKYKGGTNVKPSFWQ